MKYSNPECKGCPSGPDCDYTGFINDCPCKKCLVKAACSSICDPYVQFLHNSISIKHKGLKFNPFLQNITEPIMDRIENVLKMKGELGE